MDAWMDAPGSLDSWPANFLGQLVASLLFPASQHTKPTKKHQTKLPRAPLLLEPSPADKDSAGASVAQPLAMISLYWTDSG